MIDRTSKLYIQHPSILHQAMDYSLPVLWTDKKSKLPKEKSSQIGILLNRLTKERMIGSIIEETRSRKYSSGKRKVNSLMGNYEEVEKREGRKNTSIEGPETFISAFDASVEKGRPRVFKLPPSPLRTRLPSISSPRLKQKEVTKQVWERISREGRLKRDLLLTFISRRTYPLAAETFIRFFEPPFQCPSFKLNQFLAHLGRLPDPSRKFFQFQMLDLDNDGIISPRDILDIYMILTSSQLCSEQLIKQIDKLSVFTQQYITLQQKPTPPRTIFQTVICDRTSTLSKVSSLIDPEYKSEGSLSQYVHRSSYRNSFLMFGHNGKMRARSNMIEEAKKELSKIKLGDSKGLGLGMYLQVPLNFLEVVIGLFSMKEEGFRLVLQ